MKKRKLLSAVVLSISAIQSVAPMVASASLIEFKGVSGGNADNTPAVLRFQAEHKHVESERLLDYEKVLAKEVGFTLAQRYCGSVSGSGYDWDDCREDC